MEKRNKRLLFIYINFYEYIQKIKETIEDLDYIVDTLCEDPKMRLIDSVAQKLNGNYIYSKSRKIQKKFINDLTKKNIEYDLIFVLKGEKIEKEFLLDLKKLNPKAKFILYMWDDVARVSSFFYNKLLYDIIYTFDENDASKFGLNFLPLFFCDDFVVDNAHEKSIDVFFSGWEHSSRRQILDKIAKVLKDNNMNYYYHLYTSTWKILKLRILNKFYKNDLEYIKNSTLSLKDNANLTINSKILIDIHHPTQNGLTLRTIESIAANCKLITTNINVTKYDFYNPRNILVIDRENVVVDSKFLTQPYEMISDEIVKKYTLKNWAKTILNE